MNIKNEEFEIPKVTIILFNNEDIITESNGGIDLRVYDSDDFSIFK